MATASDLPFLIRLLDDHDPAVAPVITEQISGLGGDISDDLAALGIPIGAKEKKRLTELLAPGRRETLRNEWLAPSGGAFAIADDWDSFENMLRQISDYLHDGITLRPSLSDSLDLLVNDLLKELQSPSADEIREWLFTEAKNPYQFKGAKSKADTVKYFDLSHVIDTREGNPTSLSFLFMLVSARLGIDISGCNYPGHFLTKISVNGEDFLVDGYHSGRKFNVQTLLNKNPAISPKAQAAVTNDTHLGTCMLRYLKEMVATFKSLQHEEDEQLFSELTKTLT